MSKCHKITKPCVSQLPPGSVIYINGLPYLLVPCPIKQQPYYPPLIVNPLPSTNLPQALPLPMPLPLPTSGPCKQLPAQVPSLPMMPAPNLPTYPGLPPVPPQAPQATPTPPQFPPTPPQTIPTPPPTIPMPTKPDVVPPFPVEPAPATPQASVSIIPQGYNPPSLTVIPGTTVVWQNNTKECPTVTSVDGVFDSGEIQPGRTYKYTFNLPGTYTYYNKKHPKMMGVIEVGAKG